MLVPVKKYEKLTDKYLNKNFFMHPFIFLVDCMIKYSWDEKLSVAKYGLKFLKFGKLESFDRERGFPDFFYDKPVNGQGI
jgi:hypothetical protein